MTAPDRLAEIQAQITSVYEGVEDCCTIATVDDPEQHRFCENDGCSSVLPLARSLEFLIAELARVRAELATANAALTRIARAHAPAEHLQSIARAVLSPNQPEREPA